MSQAVQFSHHWTHPTTGVAYQPREVVDLEDRLAARVIRAGHAFPTNGPDRRGYRTWFVTRNRENVDWATVVVGGVAVERIYQLRVWQDGTDAEQLTLWANLGAGVPPERVMDAREDAETSQPPPAIVPGDGQVVVGPTAESLPIRAGAGIVLRVVDGEVEVSVDPAYLGGGPVTPPEVATPTVTLTSPVAGAVLRGYTTFAGAYTTAAGLDRVELLVGGVAVATATATGGSWTAGWDTAYWADGAYVVTARVTDRRDRTATSQARSYATSNPADPTTPPDTVGLFSDYLGDFL